MRYWLCITDLINWEQLVGQSGEQCPATITDIRDGKVYPAIQIGSQCWLQKNMNYETGNSCCYDNNILNCDIYGRLYDWETALGICPSGWHLPSNKEWQALDGFLGGFSVAGGKMKSTGTIQTGTGLWNDPNTGATNESKFTGLPAGDRHYFYGSFENLSNLAAFWSSSEYSSSNAFMWYLVNYAPSLPKGDYEKTMGISVRCVKD